MSTPITSSNGPSMASTPADSPATDMAAAEEAAALQPAPPPQQAYQQASAQPPNNQTQSAHIQQDMEVVRVVYQHAPAQSPESYGGVYQQQVRTLGPMQPLPRGRPPRSKPASSQQVSPSSLPGVGPNLGPAAWQPPSNGAPTVQQHITTPQQAQQAQQAQQPQQYQKQQPPLESAYARGGHLLGGFNPARYPGVSLPHPKFSPDGRLFLLTGPNVLDNWVEQVTFVAKSLNCLHELTKKFDIYPKPCTVQLFICETRFATAWRVLEGSISGQVWAYMRVLGYSSIQSAGEGLMSPTPRDCFEYAKRAASRMLIPGTPQQPPEERKRMVEEVLMAQSTDYPSERVYKKGISWLRLACDNLIKQGDYELAVALYDPIPDWAPRPPGHEDSATPSVPLVENGSPVSPEQSEDQIVSEATSATPTEEATSGVAVSESAGQSAGDETSASTPAPAKLMPDKPKKRKRAQQEDGSSKNARLEPESSIEED